jgi:hypothetical protein
VSNPIAELFTVSTQHEEQDWRTLVTEQDCSYLNRKCVKVRKSQPEIAIGTCTITHGAKVSQPIVICPHRFLERGQVFFDCLHLLRLHEPGNELHRVAEVEVPGGSIDYFLVSVRDQKVIDFVGVEFQAVDTTGTLWPPRQQFLRDTGLAIAEDTTGAAAYGVNWKMTAKTTLVQLHHKVQTFEGLGKSLVLVMQDALLAYMRREFSFQHIHDARPGHAMHFHAYTLQPHAQDYRLTLNSRASTDSQGVAMALGLQVSASMELEVISAALQRKLSAKTLLQF